MLGACLLSPLGSCGWILSSAGAGLEVAPCVLRELQQPGTAVLSPSGGVAGHEGWVEVAVLSAWGREGRGASAEVTAAPAVGGWGCDGHSHCWALAPNVGQVSRGLSILGWLWELCGCVAEVLCRVKAKAAVQVVLCHWQLLLLLPGSFLCICVASKREAKSVGWTHVCALGQGDTCPRLPAGEDGMSTWSPLVAHGPERRSSDPGKRL